MITNVDCKASPADNNMIINTLTESCKQMLGHGLKLKLKSVKNVKVKKKYKKNKNEKVLKTKITCMTR